MTVLRPNNQLGDRHRSSQLNDLSWASRLGFFQRNTPLIAHRRNKPRGGFRGGSRPGDRCLAGLCFVGALGSQAQGSSITQQPADQSVSLGATARFTVTATSTAPPITYQWRFNDVPLDPALNPSATRSMLSLTNVTLASAGRYSVVVNDTNGSATSQDAILTGDPTFTKITTGPVVSDLGGWGPPTWWDYDNDGSLDLYCANASTSGNVEDATYHNEDNGSFSKVTNAISTRLGTSWAGAVGDYNNDGYEDLFAVHNFGADDLYRNDGEEI